MKKEKYLVFLVSTDGEGEPPVAAEELYEFINSERAPNLECLHYSVLGLGDSSYKHYCKIGKDFDQRLEQLGATRIFDRVDCDLADSRVTKFKFILPDLCLPCFLLVLP